MRNGVKRSKKGEMLLRFTEKLGVAALGVNAQSASIWFCYQEEEPDGIADLLKRKSVNC